MRDIKFRAWDKRDELHQMIYLQGFLSYGEGWFGGNSLYKFYELHFAEDGFMKVNAKDIEIMQYTGLKDKNGKEIYEGDILFGVADEPCVVSWNIHYASFVLDKKGWMFSHWFGESCDPENVEVVGNIYENPEFLK